jgi:hypothetical protein
MIATKLTVQLGALTWLRFTPFPQSAALQLALCCGIQGTKKIRNWERYPLFPFGDRSSIRS